MRTLRLPLYFLIVGMLASCSFLPNETLGETSQPLPTPTLHPFFIDPTNNATPQLTQEEYTTFAPTHPPEANIISLPQVITTTIYDDELNKNWLYLNDPDVTANFASKTTVHDGQFALSLSPKKDFKTMYFVVREDTNEIFTQDQVISLNFWLNSGNDILDINDLAVTIVGSNEYPYWVEGDNSVYIEGQFPFSETRLVFLGLNHAIPPNTWVEIEVVINSLIYDPAYKYITGFYIKNDQGFYNTFYVDNIRMVKLAPIEQNTSATSTPTNTMEPTLTTRNTTPTLSATETSQTPTPDP
ncbi:MAG: hypothetical protein H6636_08430 [Anaerolineales bacterium]|nr:hypothetical protein [Anaerolineales bacterium]